MSYNKMKSIEQLLPVLEDILSKMEEMQKAYSKDIEQVHSAYSVSAKNLIDYLALRTFNIDRLNEKLKPQGLPEISSDEDHIRRSVVDLKRLINSLLQRPPMSSMPATVSMVQGQKLIKKNTKQLFGYKSKKRKTRIMVTLPNTAAEDLDFVRKLLRSGMNCARINCAHDDASVWLQMVEDYNGFGRTKTSDRIDDTRSQGDTYTTQAR